MFNWSLTDSTWSLALEVADNLQVIKHKQTTWTKMTVQRLKELQLHNYTIICSPGIFFKLFDDCIWYLYKQSIVWLPSTREYNFWLRRVRSLPCVCAYVALFACRLAYNHYAIAHTYDAANAHAHGSDRMRYSLVEGNQIVVNHAVTCY